MKYYGSGWKTYVPVATRRRRAARESEKLTKQGSGVSPIRIEGRTIAKTVWGKAWCDNLERYSDYANRLPRGRTYLRNGFVVDLQITPGAVHALVSGSSLYKVTLTVAPVANPQWKSICNDCAGAIDSLVELLQGRLSKAVMERICRQSQGLFPAPAEIQLACSCPDWAGMCKHVAAVLYGIGARFDHQPELLFRLRAVDEMELIGNAGIGVPLAQQDLAASKILGSDDLSAIFGLDILQTANPEPPPPDRAKSKQRKQAAPTERRMPAPVLPKSRRPPPR